MNALYGIFSKKNSSIEETHALFTRLAGFYRDSRFQLRHFRMPSGFIGTCLLKNLDTADYIYNDKKIGLSIAIGPTWGQTKRAPLLKSLLRQRAQNARFIRFKTDGVYSFLVYEKDQQRLSLINDKLGLHPLYISETNEYLMFSTHAEPLFCLHPSKPLDLKAIAEFFVFGHIFEGKTFMRGVRNLPPGNMLNFKNGRMSIKKYFRFIFPVVRKKSDERIINVINKIIKKSIDLRASRKNKIYCHLTGGFDTRTVLAHLMASHKKITVLTELTNWVEPSDILIARKISRFLRSLNHWFYCETFLEPKKIERFQKKLIPSIFRLKKDKRKSLRPTKQKNKLAFMKELAQNPIFSGLCGGELIGQTISSIATPLDPIPRHVLKIFFKRSDKGLSRYLCKELPKIIRSENKCLRASNFLQHKIGLFIFHILRSNLANVYARGWYKPERFFNSHVVSYPFLDIRLIRAVSSVPPHQLNHHLYYQIIKKNHPDFIGPHMPLLLKRHTLSQFKDEFRKNPDFFCVSRKFFSEEKTARTIKRSAMHLAQNLCEKSRDPNYGDTIDMRAAAQIVPDRFLLFHSWVKTFNPVSTGPND